MPISKKKVTGGAKVSELQALQSLVVASLTKDISDGIVSGDTPQPAIKNALQILRDNNILAVDDTIADFERLSSLLPQLDTEAVSERFNKIHSYSS